MTALDGKALLDHGRAIAKRYAGRVGSDVAEELGAEAVLRALRSPPPDGRLEPWLERIYRNLFVDMWRRRRPSMVNVDDLPELAIPGTPEDALLGCERRRAVRSSLAGLPREARRALLSRYYAELDDDVSATRLGIATATIRTRIHRALGRLRGRLVDLRGLLPPMFGQLGAGASALGLAPVLVAALAVVSTSSRLFEGAPVCSVSPGAVYHGAAHHAILSAPASAQLTPVQVPVAAVAPRPQTRHVLPAGAAALPVQPAPAVVFIESDPVVADIQSPVSIDIFADPVQVTSPCLVEAPTNFLVQIEKMVEDSL